MGAVARCRATEDGITKNPPLLTAGKTAMTPTPYNANTGTATAGHVVWTNAMAKCGLSGPVRAIGLHVRLLFLCNVAYLIAPDFTVAVRSGDGVTEGSHE